MTSILTARFLINLQEVKQRLADSSPSLSGELEFQHSRSRNSGGFLGSLGGNISFDGDHVEDDGDEAAAIAAEATEVAHG